MSSFVPEKVFLRGLILHHFLAKKTPAETHRLLVDVYGVHAPSANTCERWFNKFRKNDFNLSDKEHGKPAKKFEDAELEQLLDEDPCQTQQELAAALGVTQACVSQRLQAMGMVQKQGNWVPHDLRERDVERRNTMCELLLARHKRKSFLHRIVTGDEKWIHYDNPKRKPAYVKRGQRAPSTPKPNIHGSKVMLCIWWDMLGVIYYELLKPGETVTGDRYRQQLIRLKRALTEKRPQYANRHESVILQHDNARPHVAIVVKNYLEGQNWEILPHPPYSPDIAPSDYHLFRSMQNALSRQKFRSDGEAKKWVDDFIAQKEQEFFTRGIRLLPERWAKVVASDGQYFE